MKTFIVVHISYTLCWSFLYQMCYVGNKRYWLFYQGIAFKELKRLKFAGASEKP
jgi:hypothetical protein